MSEQVLNAQVLEQMETMNTMVYNAYMSRQTLIDKYLDPRRDLYKECGHPTTEEITIEKYKELYDREPVAVRVVEVLPEESWKTVPEVFETDDNEQTTAFEQAWKDLKLPLNGEESYLKASDNGSLIWDYLERVDKLSGIGTYGLLVIGFDDPNSDDLSKELTKGSAQNILFLRCVSEAQVDINSLETDRTNPRYGLPVSYNIKMQSPEDSLSTVGQGQDLTHTRVHWTRVLHVADNLGSSEIFGTPRMRPVFNNLHNIQKISSGSGEMFWRGAFPGLSIETHPSMGGDVEIDASALRSNLENYMNGLKRYLALTGMTARSLAPQAIDPGPHLEPQIDLICIKLGVPKRIFMGSERGELASSQDDSTWNERLAKRQNRYLTPRVVAAFVSRLIWAGVLPEPAEGFQIKWPDLDALSEDEKAGIAIKRTHALTKYVQGSVEMIMSPLDFYVSILGMDQEEAQQIIDNAVEAFEANEDREFARQLRERDLFDSGNDDQIKKGLQKSANDVVKDAQSGTFTDVSTEAEQGLNDGLV